MIIVCEVCGDIGYKKLLIYCRGCEDSASHQYCFNKVVYDGSLADWLCFDCQQRSGEVSCRGSLEVSSERPSHAHSGLILQQSIAKTVESAMDAGPCKGKMKSGKTKYASLNKIYSSKMNSRPKKHNRKKSNVRTMGNHDNRKGYDTVVLGLRSCEAIGTETSKNDNGEDQHPIPLTDNFVDDCNVMDGLMPEKEKHVVRLQLDYRATDELQHRSIAANVTQQAALQDDVMDNVMTCSPNMCILDKEDIENQNMPSEDIENQNRKENQSEPSKMMLTQQAALQDDAMDNVMLCSPNVCILDKEDIENQNMPSQDIENQNRKENQSEPSKMIVTQQATLQDDAMDNVMLCSPNVCILDKEDIENQNMPSEDIENQNRKENQSEPSKMIITQQAALQDDAMDNVMPCSPNMCILDKEDIENQNMPSEDIENQNQKENQSEPSNLFDWASLEIYPAKILPEDISVDFGKDNPRKQRHLILDDDDDDHDEDKAEDVHLENVQSGDLSDSNGSNGGPVEKRRRYVDANEDEDEEADKVEETVQIGDLSYSDCSNGGPVKKRRRYVDANEDEDEEADKVEETVQIGDLSYSDCSNGGPVKKRRRYIDASEDENDDEEAVIDVANASSAQNNVANGVLNDGTNLELQTAIPEEHPPRSRIPSDSDTADQQYYVHSRPIDEPIWSGDFKIKSEVFGKLDAHLSHKACEKVWDFSRMLQPVVEAMKIPRWQAWPKRWKSATPNDDCIGLFFFPRSSRPNEESNKLLNEIIESDDALKVSIGVIELLIFPSTLLSEQNQLFQGKHYLWGVFKRRKDKSDRGAFVGEYDGVACSTEESKLQEQHVLYQQVDKRCESSGQETSVVKHIVHVENEIMVERNCVAQNVAMEIAKREVITLPDSKLSYTKPNSPEDGSRCSVHQRIDVDLHAPEEMSQQAPESNASSVTKSTTECGHGESHSGSRLPTTKLCGLVVARTPRAQQLLEEMISEGELVFSVGEQTETTNFCTGSNVGVGSGLNPDTDYQHLHEHPRPFDFISTGHAVPDVASEACLELFPVQQEKIGWAPRVEATKEVDLDLSLGARSQAPSMKL